MENKSPDREKYYCSNCGQEVGFNDQICSKCGAELMGVDEDSNDEKTTVIRTYMNEFEAEISKSILEEEGIESFITKDDEGSMNPALNLALGIRLHVLEKDVEKAEEILKSVENANNIIDPNFGNYGNEPNTETTDT